MSEKSFWQQNVKWIGRGQDLDCLAIQNTNPGDGFTPDVQENLAISKPGSWQEAFSYPLTRAITLFTLTMMPSPRGQPTHSLPHPSPAPQGNVAHLYLNSRPALSALIQQMFFEQYYVPGTDYTKGFY